MANKFVKVVRESASGVRAFISAFGKITSIAAGGQKLNASNIAGAEVRDFKIVTPYGISSCGVDGLFVQLCINGDNDNNTAVGVFDPSRPQVSSGEIVIYNKHGDTIRLSAGGGITLTGAVTVNGSLVVNGDLTTSGGVVRLN